MYSSCKAHFIACYAVDWIVSNLSCIRNLHVHVPRASCVVLLCLSF